MQLLIEVTREAGKTSHSRRGEALRNRRVMPKTTLPFEQPYVRSHQYNKSSILIVIKIWKYLRPWKGLTHIMSLIISPKRLKTKDQS